MVSPLLSVVIPTHNRAEYATSSIQSLLSIPDQRLQVIVHDTSDTHELNKAVDTWKDHRLIYVRSPALLDQVGNHNAAMMLATGEYVCVIGDDDTILPSAIEAAEWAKEHNFECIASTVVPTYLWPDFRSRYFGSAHAGRLYLASPCGGARSVDSRRALLMALRNGVQGTHGLPKIYHGIVRREIMERLRQKSGGFFHGSSPDVSGAVALACEVPVFVELEFPITLPGAGGKSASGESALNKHRGKLQGRRQTAASYDSWPDEIPKFFSAETVWAHSAIETLKRFDPSLVDHYGFLRLYGLCVNRHPSRWREVSKAFRAYQRGSNARLNFTPGRLVGQAIGVLWERCQHAAKRVLLPTAAGGRAYVGGITDIAEAQGVAIKAISELNGTFSTWRTEIRVKSGASDGASARLAHYEP